MNVLIALFNSAYEDITDNAIDEYLALFSQRTMQFVRAPDENVFIPPLNLIEIFGLIIPFEWWMSKSTYERVNHWVMFMIYSPLLLLTAAYETHTAYRVSFNRKRGESDDDIVEEWEEISHELDFEGEGWAKAVDQTKPNVVVDGTLLAVQGLKKEIEELKEQLGRLTRENTPAP